MKCPKCNKKIGLGKQMQEWDKYYGVDCVLDPEMGAFINIFCEKCNAPTVSVYVELGGYEMPPELEEKVKKDIENYEKQKKRPN